MRLDMECKASPPRTVHWVEVQCSESTIHIPIGSPAGFSKRLHSLKCSPPPPPLGHNYNYPLTIEPVRIVFRIRNLSQKKHERSVVSPPSPSPLFISLSFFPLLTPPPLLKSSSSPQLMQFGARNKHTIFPAKETKRELNPNEDK